MGIYQILGFSGSALVLAAYAPQTYHLWKEHCSAGISRYAYVLWLISALFLLTHALMIHDTVFILLQGINTIFTGIILLLAEKYKYGLCAFHQLRSSQ